MTAKGPTFERLFDADAYYASGGMPWSFCAYSNRFADALGHPTDPELLAFLALIQSRGVVFGFWRIPGDAAGDWLVVVPKDEIQRTMTTLLAMRAEGTIPKSYPTALADRLCSTSRA